MSGTCKFDPTIYQGVPIGMFHCPECGEMVMAGLPHPDYSKMIEEHAATGLDRIARYLINEALVKTDDMRDEEVPEYVEEVISALRARLETADRLAEADERYDNCRINKKGWGEMAAAIAVRDDALAKYRKVGKG